MNFYSFRNPSLILYKASEGSEASESSKSFEGSEALKKVEDLFEQIK